MKSNQKHYHLTAGGFGWQVSDEKTIQAWGFNHVLPGPALRVKKGDELVVHFTNNLPEPSIIHWHGIRLPAAMDGNGEDQQPILPGETFTFRFVVPDAGTYWYHAHANETVQMERGMYGALIVEDDTDPILDADRVFMIDDMKLTADHAFKESSWFLPRFAERHDGREGDTLLINGRENPIIQVHAGQMERWRFINASSARYFVLYLEGHAFKIIGTDGGLLEKPRTVTRQLITPGERFDIIAGPFAEGETFAIESLGYNRRTFLQAKRQQFATVLVGAPQPSVAVLPDTLSRIEPLARQDAPVNRKVKLSVGPSLEHGIDFLVNNQLHAHDQPVKVGELQIWEVANTSLMDHPFHLHGFFFQVLDENGKAPEYLAWKDTYNLPPRSKIKIAWMPDNRPGSWMYHCHILEHHAAGMMAHFEVVDPGNPNPAGHHGHHGHASHG